MSHLQKLLDEKWPLDTAMSECDQDHLIYARKLFEAGYNAAIQEIKDAKKPIEAVLQECRNLISEGRKAAAILHYKNEIGVTVQEAAYALGIF